MRLRPLAAVCAATLAAAAPAAAQTFTFEGVAAGTVTPFTSTVGGVTATFAAANQATGSLAVVALPPGFAPGISGNVLQQPSGLGALLIAFSQPLTSVTFNFATNGVSAINLLLFQGATQVGGGTFASALVSGFTFPGGVATLGYAGAGGFDRISVSSQTPPTQFLVDNVAVTPAAVVPEPASVALLGVGLAGAGAVARRRGRRAA